MTSRPSSSISRRQSSALPINERNQGDSRASSAQASPALRDDIPLPEDEIATNVPYVSVTHESLVRPHNFKPFFSLVEDASSGEVAHAAVHYVFADDDPEVMTAASLRALGADDSGGAGSVTTMRRVKSVPGEDLDSEAEQQAADVLPPLRPGVQERYIIIDMAEDGQTVTSAKSLSPEWAVTNTIVEKAPTFDGEDPNQAAGLMLKVEGISTSSKGPKQKKLSATKMFDDSRASAKGDDVAAMTQLVGNLRKNMKVLEKVMLGGEVEGEEV